MIYYRIRMQIKMSQRERQGRVEEIFSTTKLNDPFSGGKDYSQDQCVTLIMRYSTIYKPYKYMSFSVGSFHSVGVSNKLPFWLILVFRSTKTSCPQSLILKQMVFLSGMATL